MKRSQRLLCQILTLASWLSCATGLASLRISRLKGIVQLSGRITANPGSSPKIGLCPDWPQYVRYAVNERIALISSATARLVG